MCWLVFAHSFENWQNIHGRKELTIAISMNSENSSGSWDGYTETGRFLHLLSFRQSISPKTLAPSARVCSTWQEVGTEFNIIIYIYKYNRLVDYQIMIIRLS